MSILGKIFMFLSSYSPLYLFIITLNYSIADIKISLSKILDINQINSNDIILYILISLTIVSNMILYILLITSKRYSEPVKILEIQNGNEKVLDYILAYIVSFVCTDFAQITNNDSKGIVTAILIQILLGYLYCKSNMFYINPVLNFIGYDIYLIKTSNDNFVLLNKNKNAINKIQDDIMRNGSKSIELNYLSKGIYISK
ncbi:hypothetical protein PMY38_15580 [Clostridium tertium]|uniref:hypothetical protein n=1 Tax=Clostridium tertium TaxID=1559 RepID=UPI00232FAC75|nr:hypothetical protein [Clostridium tertium]MDB1956270.1 hypothetical protein [Clostridium tertium]MDB1960020.1 hypothetical protein [Clostridium tertium]MDB1963939.1 hypothetical protein [Clostridium tertium]MDB1967370.1 hypothetical protein [Clostridium tertium]